MKAKTRLICYVLIVCMLFSSISVAASGLNAETDANQNSPVKSSYSQTFPDIEGHWCKES